ncbi:hypothetical protein LINPERHAP2_LOCUS9262 [Linum perenne]
MEVDEMVAMFLLTIGPSAKNRTCQVLFHRSAETMSHTIKKVLLSIVNHQALLISQPVPVPESCDNHKLKYFKDSENEAGNAARLCFTASCLLHNFIRTQGGLDVFEMAYIPLQFEEQGPV